MTVAIPKKKKTKTVKDFEKLLFNYITGKLDLALEFNSSRIVTHERNQVGYLMQTYDASTNLHLDSGPHVVTDNEGNVISIGAGPGAAEYF